MLHAAFSVNDIRVAEEARRRGGQDPCRFHNQPMRLSAIICSRYPARMSRAKVPRPRTSRPVLPMLRANCFFIVCPACTSATARSGQCCVRRGSRPAALEVFAIRPVGIREAIAAALRNEDSELAQTRWSDSLSTANSKGDWGDVRFGNRIVDTRTLTVARRLLNAVIDRALGEPTLFGV
jgi:hypothetical protein